jgi:alpha-L-rhamnosidase
MTRTPHSLSIDSGGDQFVVSGSRPRLSFQVPVGIGRQTSYSLEATVDGQPRSAVAGSGDVHRFIAWPWEALRSAQRVQWRVRVSGTDAVSEWSEPHEFEVGLLDDDWTAAWISAAPVAEPAPAAHPAYLLSGEFDVPAEVVSARLYATALGLYDVRVNGERLGTVELAPGSTSYDRTLYAQAYDAAGAIEAGMNRIDVLLSDGWYRGEVGAFRVPAAWGDTTAARAELHLELVGGERLVVRTDATWTSAPSAVTRASLMDGETLDLTTPAVEAAPVRVGIVEAPAISWSPAPPVRVVETRPPVSVSEVREGVWVADFGQNASGWIRLSDLGPAGTRTVIDHGEFVASDGDLSTSHLDSHRPDASVVFVQRDEVVSDGSGVAFEPRHTVHGFQYARITREGAPLDEAALEMRVVHTDLRAVGGFASSSEDLNRLHEIAAWSFRGNAVDVPTDCPTRERLAWTGDYQVFAPTATRLFDVLGFTRKWLRSVRDDQLADGRIANFSPDGRRIKNKLDDQFAQMTGSSGWGDAIVAVPWEMCQSYGDTEVLAENWDAMTRWVEWVLFTARTARHPSRQQRSTEPAPHEEFVWDGSFHWGEWVEPKQKDADGNPIDPVQQNPMVWFMADKGEVGTAYLYRSTLTLARIAEVLGREEDHARYAALAERVLEAWRTEFLRPDGRTVGDTQAAYVRALSFELVPDELRGAAASRLVELIREAGTHLGTGFLSTGDLLPVLTEAGYADVAYELLHQRSAPSWLYMLDRGATTIWEEWEGIDERGRAHESLNHYSKGAVIRFLHMHVLGLRQAPESIAWESFVVAPVPAETVTWARGHHDSPQGRIDVAWRTVGDGLEVTVTVPPGANAKVVLPSGRAETFGSGGHTLTGR